MGINNFSSEHSAVGYFTHIRISKFTSVTGGEVTRDGNPVHPGDGDHPVIITGPATVGAITVTKPYDPILDAALRAWALNAIQNGLEIEGDLVKQPVNAANINAGAPIIYKNCKVTSLKDYDLNKGSSEQKMIELVVQARYVI